MGTITPLILVASLAFTAAVPTGIRHSCAQTCSSSDASKFSYEQGTSYVYDYEVTTTFLERPYGLSLNGTWTGDPFDVDGEDVTVTGKATVGVLGPCEFVLSMSDISLDGSSESEQFASKVSQKPLRFAYDEGKISNICSVEGEEEWVLNFKRGVLSNFQNSMRTLENQQTVTEIDITGECKTTYDSVALSSDTTQITKTKSAGDCTRTPVGSQTTLPKQFQNMPIISADVTCEQTVTGGIMKETHCNERINIKQFFHNGGDINRLTTLIKTKIQLTSETSGVISADFSNMKISTLEFQNDKSRKDDPMNLTKIELLLSELVSKSSPVMRKEVPALFSELVKRLKTLDTPQMSYLYGDFKASKAWKILVDAAPLVSTAASTSIMTELVKEGDLTTMEADIWYSSLAFVQNPDPDMFIPLTNLINEVHNKNAIIGAASLLKQYCQTDSNCLTKESVTGLVSAIEQKLGSACRSTSVEEKENILVSLRALKIVGQWTKQDVLNSCFMDVENPSDIRVAAIEVYKSAPCSYDKSQIIEIYSNAKYDSELRINAYLALMACPTEEHVQLIKNILMSESANHVGTFVWTHLSNLQESASHEKQWIRLLIGEESIMKKFNSTAIQNSRNMETSFYMEELGIGSTVESNIIFSSNSFLPRSGMFNLSFDIFGESINFIEVGGRFENFEIFAQKFFGTDGYYPDKIIEQILKQLRQNKREEETSFEGMWADGIINKSQSEGSYYMRLFGTDVGYHSFHGIENFYEMQPKFDISTFLAQFMSSGETQYSKSFKFVDTELQYPTTSGFPLSLKLDGTADVGIKVDGEFSMRGFTDMDIHGHFYPSAAFEMDASMMVDTHFAKSGFKMRLNGETSVMLDGNIKIDGAKIVDITLNMPEQEQIQLLSVKSNFVIIKNNVELEPKTAYTPRIYTSCMPMIGVELCSQYGPNVFFNMDPMFPNEISFFFSKTDVHDSYKLRYLNEENSVSLLVDMPNSAFDRKISLTAVNHGDEFKLDIHTPWKSITSTALVALEGNEPKVDIEMTIDNVRKYQGGVELRNNRIGTMQTYIPSIFLMTSGQKIVDITGRIERESSENKLDVTIESKGLLPTNVKYSWDPKRGSTAIDILFNSPILEVSAKLGNELNHNKFHTEFELDYNFMRKYTNTIKFDLNLQDLSQNTESFNKYIGSLDFYNNFVPFDKIHIDTEIMCNNTYQQYLSFKTNVDVGNLFNMDAEAKYTSPNFQEVKLELSSKSKTHPFINVEESAHFKKDNNKYLGEHTISFMGDEHDKLLYPQKTFNTVIELEYASDSGFIKAHHITEVHNDKIEKLLEASYSRPSDGHYNTKASFNEIFNSEKLNTFNWESSIIDRSHLLGIIDNDVSFEWNLNDNHQAAHLTSKVNNLLLAVNGIYRNDGHETFLDIKTTSESLDFKTNFRGINVILGAKMNTKGSEKLVEVNGKWGEKTMDSRISFNGKVIEAEFRVDTNVKKFRAEITETGAKITLNLTPSKTVVGELHYSFHKNKSDVKVTVRTPFGAYTKQELILSLNHPTYNEFSSVIGLTWKDMNLITINASGKLDRGTDLNKATLSISSVNDPSVFGFEQGSFLVTNTRSGYDLDSTIEGSFDGVQLIKGAVKTKVENSLATIDVRLSTTSHNFIVRIEAKLDDGSFNISLENGLSGGKIYLAGQLIGDAANLYRSKRSAEFSMINDASSAGIGVNFNSISIKVSNPYTSARETSFFMERKDNGEFQLHYKRNDNIIDFSVTPLGQRKFNISLTSAVPGWEFLALTGRLNQEELFAYLSGQINEAKMTVSGGGTYSRINTSLNFDITTPYQGYDSISAKLEFNIEDKKINLDIRSPSSKFHILVKRDAASGLTIDVYVPNREEPTIIDGRIQLGTGIGHLKFSSRFSSIPSLHMEYSFNYNHQIFEIHLRRGGHHSEFHFERTRQKSVSYIFRRDGKEFKVEAQNSGQFPTNGKITFAINNSFRTVPRTISGSLLYDRTRSIKTFELQFTLPSNQNIVIAANYDINLARPQKGNVEAIVTISGHDAQIIEGSWDNSNHDNVTIKIKVDRIEYELKGKLGIYDTNISLTPSDQSFEKIDLIWNFYNSYNAFNFKAGTVHRFVSGKLELESRGNQGIHVTLSIQASSFMSQPLAVEFIWNHDSNNGLTASGTFEYGPRNGSFDLSKLKRTASNRSFELQFEANTNHPAINKLTVNCDYSFNNAAIFNLDIDWGISKIGVHFDIKNITSDFTQQTAKITLPSYGDVEINFGHDFREQTKKFTITSSIQGRQYGLKAEWTINRFSTKFNGKVDIESLFFGTIKANGSYDFRNLNNAQAEIKYTRGNKYFNFGFKHLLNANELISKINFSSSHPFVKTAKMEVDASFSNENCFTTLLLQRLDRKIDLRFSISPNKFSGRLTTPYRGMELITGSFSYNISHPISKIATLRYERGNRKINVDMEFHSSSGHGKLKVTMITPFEIIKTLNLNAKWGNGRGTVEYKRNNISYRFEGTADVKIGRTFFDLSFTPNSGQPIHIKFIFNVGSILSGTGNIIEDIAKMELEMLGKRIAFDIKGYRNGGKIVLEFEGDSSFNLTGLGPIELKLNFDFGSFQTGGFDLSFTLNSGPPIHMKFNFNVGSILSGTGNLIEDIAKMELKMLGKTVAFDIKGYRNSGRVVLEFEGEWSFNSTGLRQIELKLDTYQLSKGFSGNISVNTPNIRINDASFDVNYKFNNQNELDLNVNLQLEQGKMINIDIIYNSDGIQARLTSPLGSYRAQRSVSDNSFHGEIGLDDYNISLHGDILNADFKTGFKLEGEFFGHRISFDTLLQIAGNNYAEGKFLINSNIPGYEKNGVLFKFSNENESVSSQTQINLPFITIPEIIVTFESENNSDSKRARLHLIAGEIEYKLGGHYIFLPDGYEAEISVETPHEMRKFTVEGKLKMNSMNKMDASLKIIYPSGYFLVQTNYDLSPTMESSSISSIILRSILTPSISAGIYVEKLHNTSSGSHTRHCGGSLKLRSNSPYELEANCKADMSWDGRFHVMMDSAIRTILFTHLGFIE